MVNLFPPVKKVFRIRTLQIGLVLMLLAGGFTASSAGSQAAPPFTFVDGFATKTGFRAVFVWEASTPVAGVVNYGTSPAILSNRAMPLGNPVDRAQYAVADVFFPAGTIIYYEIQDLLTGAKSAVQSFPASNAWNLVKNVGPHGFVYEINLIAQIDTQALPDIVPFDQGVLDLARALDITAERIWDATDGYVRIGKVLVTDTNANYPLNQPFGPGVTTCGVSPNPTGAIRITIPDILVQTSIPFDSHTWGGGTPVISTACTAIYLGREGQLVVPWGQDTHVGYVTAHELSHYAFGAPDLYPAVSSANCVNPTHRITMMHNTGGYSGAWSMTEYDRHPVTTPCSHGTEPWTWAQLATYYPAIPAATAVPLSSTATPDLATSPLSMFVARGHPDGGGLSIYVLDHTPPLSDMKFCGANPGPGLAIACV